MKIKDKLKDIFKNPKRRIIIISISLAAVLIIIAVVVFVWFRNQGRGRNIGFGNMPGGRGNFTISEDVIAAGGITGVGITEESFDVENLATGLEIEEIYIVSESEITEGTKVLKFSEESIAEAREELEKTLKEADLAYRAGGIEYEQNKITAEYERDSKILNGKYAKAVYDETVAGLQDAVDKAQEEVTESRDQIAEYRSYVPDGSYREYFEVDKYEEIYYENLDVIQDKLEDWGVEWTRITGQGGGMSSMGGNQSNMNSSFSSIGIQQTSANTQTGVTVSGSDAGNSGNAMDGGNTSNSGNTQGTPGNASTQETASASDIQMLSSMYKILEDNKKDWDQAQSNYEDAVANASLNLQTLELSLPGLEQALTEAEENYEVQVLQAKLAYETALASAESAESDYDTAIQKAESDYEILKTAWEDAEENLELFENTVGDGYFYASASGTILSTMVKAGQNLTSEGIIFLYSNPEEMTVTVSVDQDDISGLSLGDSAYIQSQEYGSFEGSITEMNPVSGSSSRTSVTYDVTVTISGDTGNLPANESVTVIFGMDENGISGGGIHEKSFE